MENLVGILGVLILIAVMVIVGLSMKNKNDTKNEVKQIYEAYESNDTSTSNKLIDIEPIKLESEPANLENYLNIILEENKALREYVDQNRQDERFTIIEKSLKSIASSVSMIAFVIAIQFFGAIIIGLIVYGKMFRELSYWF